MHRHTHFTTIELEGTNILISYAMKVIFVMNDAAAEEGDKQVWPYKVVTTIFHVPFWPNDWRNL